MKRLHLHLTESQLNRLRELQDSTGQTVAAQVRQSVVDYLQKHEPKAPAKGKEQKR